MKYVECRGGFLKFHPPPHKIHRLLAKRSKGRSHTFKHPPPVGKPGQNQYDYTRTYRAAQRIALECERGSPKVKDALHNSL